MLGSEGKPPAAVMMAQITHDTAIARITYVANHETSDKVWKDF